MEKILCAAIWYDDDKEHVHQPTNIPIGYVMCGRRHHNIISLRYDLTGEETKEISEQGFLTNTNRFVDREEAYKIAVAAGQVIENNQRSKLLFSEDLY